jgi:hypothetical protein
MSDQYEEAFTATDEQNITYIQYIHQDEGNQLNFQIIPNHEIFKQDEICEETLCEELIETDDNNTTEVLESVVNIGKKTAVKKENVSKKLVQISGSESRPKGRKRIIPGQTRSIRKQNANTNKAYVNAKGKLAK